MVGLANNSTSRLQAVQRGVGLIEVLVSVLVLSIGLLGIAWVQTRALSNNNSSMARTMAVTASYSILDALRADRVNATDYNGEINASDCDAPGAGGSLAERNLNNWCNELADALGPVATTIGEIDCTTVAGDNVECTVTVTYDDSRIGEGGTDEQIVETKGML